MRQKRTLHVTVIVQVLLVSCNQAWVITQYEHKSHRGDSIHVNVEGNNCANVPHGWKDRA